MKRLKEIVVTAISRFKYASFFPFLPALRSALINEVLLTRWKRRVSHAEEAKNRDLTPGDYRSPLGWASSCFSHSARIVDQLYIEIFIYISYSLIILKYLNDIYKYIEEIKDKCIPFLQ